MIAVITGDIIHSRRAEAPDDWMRPLKSLLETLGTTPKKWEIYRGDSFQLEARPEEALSIAFQIKAIAKSVEELDVRLAIGVGDKSYDAKRITESSGDAFVFSGETFELLKDDDTLKIKSYWPDLDEDLNMMLTLALVIIDNWSTASAETARIVLQHPDLSQAELGKMLELTQSSVSARFNRAYLYKILQLEAYYRRRFQQEIEIE